MQYTYCVVGSVVPSLPTAVLHLLEVTKIFVSLPSTTFLAEKLQSHKPYQNINTWFKHTAVASSRILK